MLRCNDDQSLSRGASASLARTLPADEDFVHLDNSCEPITPSTHHGTPKFVQPMTLGGRAAIAQPCRLAGETRKFGEGDGLDKLHVQHGQGPRFLLHRREQAALKNDRKLAA